MIKEGMFIKDIIHDIKTFRAKSFSSNSIGKFTPKRLQNFIKSYLAKNFGLVSQAISVQQLYLLKL
jgi:hypothetical protein